MATHAQCTSTPSSAYLPAPVARTSVVKSPRAKATPQSGQGSPSVGESPLFGPYFTSCMQGLYDARCFHVIPAVASGAWNS